ncbi:MAG: hypothetical protein HY724_12625 [Candidatus Rokubacteria bacterium]|nr:hypothetical protein [Candidatus Rokubacteria bacterium]
MPHILHLLKAPPSETALPVIERQSRAPGTRVTVVLLHGVSFPRLPDGVTVRRLGEDRSAADLTYADLLDLIFTADSVLAW